MNFLECTRLAENLKAAYPEDTFLVVAASCCSYFGRKLVDFGDWRLFKLYTSDEKLPLLDDDEVRETANIHTVLLFLIFCYII